MLFASPEQLDPNLDEFALSEQPDSMAVHALFDMTAPTGGPFPSDRFTIADRTQNTGRRVNLPLPDPTTQPSNHEDTQVLNTLDGFNMQPRLSVPFDGPIDVNTVSSSTVFLVSLGDTLNHQDHGGQVVGINQVVWDTFTDTLQDIAQELAQVVAGIAPAAPHPPAPASAGLTTSAGAARLANQALADAGTPGVAAGGGQVRYKQEVHPGEHPALVDPALWQEVQSWLRHNRRPGGVRLGQGALVGGLLHCRACGCAMTASHTRKGTRRYRYHVCARAHKHGWQSCPSPSISAGAIEPLVVAPLQQLGTATPWQDCASVWEALAPSEQARLVGLVVQRVDYDGTQGKITLTFHPNGGSVLAEELAKQLQEPSG